MTSVVLDVRSTNRMGVARYGYKLASHAGDALADAGLDVHVIVHPTELDEVGALPASVRVVELPPEEDRGFVRASPWLRNYIDRIHPDLYYATGYHVDPGISAPFVFTIHDLIRFEPSFADSDQLIVERFGAAELAVMARSIGATAEPFETDEAGRRGQVFARYFESLIHDLASRAVCIATVSAAVAREISSRFDMPPDHVNVVPSAVDPVFRPRGPAEISRLRGRLGLTGPYVVYVGQTRPHKRVDWLVRRFAEAAPSLPPDARLVLAGGQAERDSATVATVDACDIGGRVVFAGRLPDDDLAALYSGAVAALSASAREGFGLPPAEALACGTEAIVTDLPAHREVLGDHVTYVGVDDDGGMARSIVRAFAGHITRERRSAGFDPPTWASAARALVAAVRRSLDTSRQQLRSRSVQSDGRR